MIKALTVLILYKLSRIPEQSILIPLPKAIPSSSNKDKRLPLGTHDSVHALRNGDVCLRIYYKRVPIDVSSGPRVNTG